MELYSVIKNDRPNEELVWKCPKEDFNNNTQLIVMESEEALFVKDGVIVETFSGGKFTLNTDNYPFISKLRNKVSGGENAFNCKVFFVDKTHKLELLWGTDSPIQIRDAEYHFAVGVRARGSYSVQVEDSKKFLIKLVGVNTQSFTDEDVKSKFRTAFQTKIKVAIATVMKNCNYTILDMNTELENIGKMVEGQLAETLEEYGIKLVNLYVSDISIPENDPNYKIINESYAKAHAGKIEVDVQGAAWEKLAQKELMKDVVNNQNSGGIASTGIGLGMGIASAGAFGSMANQIFTNTSGQSALNSSGTTKPQETIKCPKCGNEVPKNNKFCGNCGNKMEEKHFCKECGKELSPTDKFCGNCGTRRDD